MARSPNQKLKSHYLQKILLEYTDPEHPMPMPIILERLEAVGIPAERKSIYDDIKLLEQLGMSVLYQKKAPSGYYVDNRPFELPELKLLIDAVQSSHFITKRKSDSLITKISELTSKPLAKTLSRRMYISDPPKAFNEDIYVSIDAIHNAIQSGRKIRFTYFDYNTSKEREYRKDGAYYLLTPIALCWNSEHYYLIAYTAKYDSLTHYRVDRMDQVAISKDAKDAINTTDFDISAYTKRHFSMYAGEEMEALLRFDNSLVNVVFDKFGTDIRIMKHGDFFEIYADVCNSPVFLSWMFQFGDLAEIREPKRLRQAMRDLVEKNLKKYENM